MEHVHLLEFAPKRGWDSIALHELVVRLADHKTMQGFQDPMYHINYQVQLVFGYEEHSCFSATRFVQSCLDRSVLSLHAPSIR